MTIIETEFWKGYRAALDDVERALVGEHKVEDLYLLKVRIEKIRMKFNLAPCDDRGRSRLPEEFHDYADQQAQATLLEKGISPKDANELLAFARRAGREMSEIDTGDEGDDDDA